MFLCIQAKARPRREKFRAYVRTVLKSRGLTDKDADASFFAELRCMCFRWRKTRELVRLWKGQGSDEKAQRVHDLSIGSQGGRKKRGEHSVLRQHLGLGYRKVELDKANKKSALWMIFDKVKPQFLNWRKAGQYVDRHDLLREWEHQCEVKIKSLESKRDQAGGVLNHHYSKTLLAAKKRMSAHEKNKKYQDMTVDSMLKLWGARVRMPSRLINLTLEQECQKVLDSWHFFDYVLWVACFSPKEVLSQHVRDADKFRDQLPQCAIVMSDQMPFWVKLRPGAQVFAAGLR
jgi:hypothetical protein